MTDTLSAILTVNDPLVADTKICGLTLLERNIRSLKQQGFAIFLQDSEDTKHLDAILPHAHPVDFEKQNRSFLKLRADVQYSLDFFIKLKNAITKHSGENLYFKGLQEFPARWIVPGATKSQSVNLDADFLIPEKIPQNSRGKTLETHLFNHILKNTEGWIAASLNKKISFPITKWLLNTAVTPNQVTVFCLIMGIFGALLLLSQNWAHRMLGALLLQFSSILDGCDGEVAKLKIRHSRVGAWLDTISDDLINNLMLVCLYVGVYRQSGSSLIFGYGVATSIVSLGVSFFLYRYLIRHNTPNAAHFRLAWDNAPDHPQNTPASSGRKSLFDRIKPVLKRDFFIFTVTILVCLDLRGTLLVLCGSVWGAFFLYLASFVYEKLKPITQTANAQMNLYQETSP